jgi:hypothetical protein
VSAAHFNAALAIFDALFTVLFAVLVALDTVFPAVRFAFETVLTVLPVAPLTARRILFPTGGVCGLRSMPCDLSSALTASDSSLTRSLSFSTSEEV